MIPVRTVSGPAHQRTIEEMERDLTKVAEDFDRAVNVEALRRIKETGEHLILAKVHSQSLRVEQELLLGRLKSTETNYHRDFCCMDGTREFFLKQVIGWATTELGQEESNAYWIYGMPGIGKTSLAHSICAILHEGNHLAGAFFCRRDKGNLSEPRNILPTLIHKLAIIFPLFRRLVAERLRNDPNLTPGSMKHTLLLELIRKLPRPPKRNLVFVIDAFDESGNPQSRIEILRALIDAAAHVPWLKIIITSRPEVDINRLFDALVGSSYKRYDLAADREAPSDLRIFAQVRFAKVASKRCLPSPWPELSLFDQAISRAAGLFIFIETIARALEQCEDPTKHLKATLRGSAGTGLTSLYGLYSSILEAQIVHSTGDFRRIIGVLLTAAPHRPLCEETIAELTGVRLDLVKMWVVDLGSLLYRDEGANGGIRVRHLSISDFFLSDDCHSDYHVDLRGANVDLGIACLRTMIEHLRFNICKLGDSRLTNADVHDLQSRIKENISDALQYSSLDWSNHVCFGADNGDWAVLRTFFEGPYALFWIEALSIMGMVSIGVPSLRRVSSTVVKVSRAPTCHSFGFKIELNLVQGVDLVLAERIEGVCRFINTFRTPISMSAPHVYISTGPFLPSDSYLSATVFNRWFTKGMKMKGGGLLSWPSPPLEWVGHTRIVTCISYSPNGCYIVSGSFDKTIRMWDAETGTAVGKPLEGHTGFVMSVAYSPDGHHIISGSSDKTIWVWDGEAGSAVGKPLGGHTDTVTCVAYSPDGRHILSGSADKTIRMWDADTGSAIGKPFDGHTSGVLSIAYSPDGCHIISGSADMTIRMWDAETGSAVGEPLKGHTRQVKSVAYSPDGRHIISGSEDKTIWIWDAETGSAVGKPLEGHTESVTCVAYSPDGHHILSGSGDCTIRMWDAETGTAVGKPLKGHSDWVRSIAYSPDGRHIISGSSNKMLRMWDAQTGSAVGKAVETHTSWVLSVAFSPDGRHIISGSADMTIQMWDAETGLAVGRPLRGHTDCVWSIAYSPDGNHIISGSLDQKIRMWDTKAGSAVGKPFEGHTGKVFSVAYSPDGHRIISGSADNAIRMWDAETGSAVGKPFKGHAGWVRSVAYSPNGHHIISGSNDETIRIWDAETGSTIGKPLNGHTNCVWSVAYSPDGHHIISGSADNTIRMWDAKTGSAVGKPLEGHTGSVRSIAYSPNGRHTVSGSEDKTIRIWDAEAGYAVGKPFEGHTGKVFSVAYSPDGHCIISGSTDGTIRMWDAETGSTVGQALERYSDCTQSVIHSFDSPHLVSRSSDETIQIRDTKTRSAVGNPLEEQYVQSSAYSPDCSNVPSASPHSAPHLSDPVSLRLFSTGGQMSLDFRVRPDSDGWVRDPEGGLLYWVPPDCHTGLHSPALLTIPRTSHIRSVSLDFSNFVFGTSWTRVFISVPP